MNSYYVNIFCISWMYFACFVLGYPIRDASSQVNEHTRNYETENLFTTLPQISRLLDVYYSLVRSDQEGYINKLIQEANPINNKLITADTESYNSLKEDSAKTAVKSGHSDENIDHDRLKRQQGWYIQYGKRDSQIFLNQGINQQGRKSQLRGYEEAVNNNKLASLLLAREHSNNNRIRAIKSALNSIPSFPIDDSNEINASDGFSIKQIYSGGLDEDIARETEVAKLEHVPQIEKSKRQQGWFVSYGKRNGAEQPLYFV